ncbi:MAG: hypothetical protein K2O43_00415, partial [Muribaculaceae bacterium]|nr:hypothetical protein [Muribaculaceae bacterium]
FCSDEKILEEVLPYIPKGVDPQRYLEDMWEQHPEQHAFSFLELAELIKDEELKRETEQQFEKELVEFFNE